MTEEDRIDGVSGAYAALSDDEKKTIKGASYGGA